MADLDISRDVISDLEIDDLEILSSYQSKINTNQFTVAVNELDKKRLNKGFRAAILNTIKNKILDLEIYWLNLNAQPDVFYSRTEPTEEQMQGKKFWFQPY